MSEPKPPPSPSAPAGVPKYVLDHAPLLHLHAHDPYRPSPLSAHLTHTSPRITFTPISIPSPPLTLHNLSQLNSLPNSNGGKDISLTSNDDVSKYPTWLEGITPDKEGGTAGEKSGVVVVVDKEHEVGKGVVDVFYFYFYAFNWGGVVLGKQLGDHVGDWEHNMIRFIDGVPKYVWLSQHANGEAYTFSCLKKDASENRPVLYSATGSHALYATPGPHDHTIPNLNLPVPFILVDETDAGPRYDPILSSYFYSYTPSMNTFVPYDAETPTGYLTFTGRWGDAEYSESDPRQKGKGLLGFKKYVGGPTGPWDKQLDRKGVWPNNSYSKGQRVRTSLDGSSWLKDTVGKLGCFGTGDKKVRGGKGVKRVNVNGDVVG